MSKIGNKKKDCEKYKMSGHREENKILRQERARKRAEHFARRKEEGKAYVYSKRHADEKREARVPEWNRVLDRFESNYGSNQPRHKEWCEWRRWNAQLDYQLAREQAAVKEAEKRANGRKNKSTD